MGNILVQGASVCDSCYLLDAQTDGELITLKLFNAQENEIVKVTDSSYKPYFFLPYPLPASDEETIRKLDGKVEVVEKRDLFSGESQTLAKILVSHLEAMRQATKLFKTVWETDVKYLQSYVYDHNLNFGTPYRLYNEELTPIDATNVPKTELEKVYADLKIGDPLKYSQILRWFSLLDHPVPQIKPTLLDLPQDNSENLYDSFILARIVNIPIPSAYRNRRVSEWLKSVVHGYLRKTNVLIPRSRELRRDLKPHRVPGALTLPPKTGIYFNTVVCDFESLYPSLIDRYNLSYETVNCPHKQCRTNRIEECSQNWICTERRGFYSLLVGALKDLRIRWFKPLAKNMTVPEQDRTDASRIADLLKLISVSAYGVTIRIHGLACPPLAECITGYGRWALRTTWRMAENRGLHPIYGDTDSIFLHNPAVRQVKNLIFTVKDELKLDLAIEKQYTLCVLPKAKKAYFGILPTGQSDIKGLTAVKSNSPSFIQHVFQQCVNELSGVKTMGQYETAKKRILTIVHRATTQLKKRQVPKEALVYSVKLYHDPKERLTKKVKSIAQPYQCAIQLLDRGQSVARGDIMTFIKVNPFNYNGQTFTVKPKDYVQSVNEINMSDYARNLSTALEQTFAPMGIELKHRQKTQISDWFEK